jgi:hypothetical protein
MSAAVIPELKAAFEPLCGACTWYAPWHPEAKNPGSANARARFLGDGKVGDPVCDDHHRGVPPVQPRATTISAEQIGRTLPITAAAPAAQPTHTHQVGGTHYTSKAIQPWDAMRAWMTRDQFIGFLAGNVIKYMARHQDKNGLEDLKKARHYLDKLIEELSSSGGGKA